MTGQTPHYDVKELDRKPYLKGYGSSLSIQKSQTKTQGLFDLKNLKRRKEIEKMVSIARWKDELRRRQSSRLLKMLVKSSDDNGNSVERCKGIKRGGVYCEKQATKGIYCPSCFKNYKRARRGCSLESRQVSYSDTEVH